MNKRLICSAAILFVLCGCSVNNKEEEKTISGCDIFLSVKILLKQEYQI